MLIEACEKISTEKGMKAIRLEVYNHNISAIAFYKKHGFEFEYECSKDSSFYIKHLK